MNINEAAEQLQYYMENEIGVGKISVVIGDNKLYVYELVKGLKK